MVCSKLIVVFSLQKEIVLPCLQTGGNDISVDLSEDSIKWINDSYAEDYENGWY